MNEKVRQLEEEKRQTTEKCKLYKKSNEDYTIKNQNLNEKVRQLEEEKEQTTEKCRLYEKSNKDYADENKILKEKVHLLEEENKLKTKKCKLYESFLLSLKEKPREFPFSDFNEYIEEDASLIGNGSTSEIKMVWKKEQYAKRELVHCFDHKTKQRFINEWETLFRYRHPCIVRLYGINYGDSTHYPSIIMSLEPRSLETAIKNKELNCEQKNRIVVELVLGMRYIHKHKFMHCNLKPMNILLSKNRHVRITDFGLADEKDLETSQPELLNNETSYTNKVDVYSFGIILFFIVTNEYPQFNILNDASGDLPNLRDNSPSFDNIFNILKENNFDLFNDSKNQKLTVKQRISKKNIEKRITKIESFEFQQKLEILSHF